MDDFASFNKFRTPTANRPLLGLTVLVVEDSRFSCEAMRLLCLRSGASIRRADCLASAHRHLQVYRPSVVIIDLGLPDGNGVELIEELNRAQPRVGIILGTSGNDGARAEAMAAGADGFLAKPIESLAAFQETILAHIPADRHPAGPRIINEELIKPDPIAFCDDMAHAAELLNDGEDKMVTDYVAQFLSGVARSARDSQLEEACIALTKTRGENHANRPEVARLAALVQERLHSAIAI
ncbi:MAG: response regulator [Rhodobacterales bacterium]|nr:MAG: response regulator [Rhodobacterales bacterium]